MGKVGNVSGFRVDGKVFGEGLGDAARGKDAPAEGEVLFGHDGGKEAMLDGCMRSKRKL